MTTVIDALMYDHWLQFNGATVTGCVCGFDAHPDDDGFGDSVVRHFMEVATEAERNKAVVHVGPPHGSGITPCCRRSPFDLPPTDLLTRFPHFATCSKETA